MVESIDHAMWERELGEHISWHPDLENLPPPVFPRRRSWLGRRLWSIRQKRRARRARRAQLRALYGQRRAGFYVIVTLLVLETLTLGGVVGWWLGWHL